MSKDDKEKSKKGSKPSYGLVGEKLGHSFSPLLHKEFGSYDYSLIEIPKDEIDRYFQKGDFKALNVTIPYKETAIRYCDPDRVAKEIGCVNTLVRTGEGIKGYNTDTFGFEYMIKRAGMDIRGRKVTILGSGGTCRTAAYTVSRLGASSVKIVSRHPSDMGLSVSCPVTYCGYGDKYEDCEVLINTTPVGMYPDVKSVSTDITNNYVNLESVIDVIYNPLKTRLIYRAKKAGIKTTGGLPMLVAQGFFASGLFTGKRLSDDPVGDLTSSEKEKIEEVIRIITEMTGNIVLTGMPGSGKTTVGKIIAKKLDLEFVDTDELFTNDNKMTPAQCIKDMGESTFRSLEKAAVYKAAASGSKVIATGGGVVLDPENIEMLSLNGTIVYINRKLGELATYDRPLSEGSENLKALYYKRLPIYMTNNDLLVDVCGDAKSVAKDIIKGLHNKLNSTNTKNLVKRRGDMNILVINGPNLNMLGIREPAIYGRQTYDDLLKICREKAEELGVAVTFYQSNHEGDLVDIIQQSYGVQDGIIINPGAYTHTSVALLDALKSVGIPAVEVHISDVDAREDFRQISYIRSYVTGTISGLGLAGYTKAMEVLADLIKKGDQRG
ncbi:MAG: type II 3-dehydroquinate dehydratase [Lachnospiraceae bacterium]|nr:type II 3-dehydroquinate dehydratase [Lachnospiraceae bacterium]